MQGIPRGIEVLVKKASVDSEFRAVLLKKRAAAATEIGLELSPAEVATLNSVPSTQIEQIIDNTAVPDEHRRVFLGKIAAAMLAILGIGLSGCSTDPRDKLLRFSRVGGIMPDDPEPGRQPMPLPDSKDREQPGSERLKVRVVYEGRSVVDVKVDYECPFDYGEIMALFGRGQGPLRARVKCKPALDIVSKGNGEITFTAEGKGGATEWLLVRLLNATEKCKKALEKPSTVSDFILPSGFEPGEYFIGNCAIYTIVKFHKVWPTEKWQEKENPVSRPS
jgi:hypothetical protein